MGLSRTAAFVRAPHDEVQAGLEHVLTLRGRKAAPWAPPPDLQHARAATSPWWSAGGFAGGADWTCVLAAPFDLLTHDGAAVLGELARACGTEAWQLDVEDGDSLRVFRAADGAISRAGFLTSELDLGLAFDPMMLVPILSDVDVAGACNALKARAPKASITVRAEGPPRRVHPAELVRELARTDCPDAAAIAEAIAAVFGGANARFVDNLITIEHLIAGRPLPVAPSFALWTRLEN